jgi:Ca2+-binding RTX toxin-like protein
MAMLLPSGALAHQTVTIEPGPGGTKTLHIVGDVTKATDEVTVTYDSVKNEYVITHDIVSVPAGCTTVGEGPPYKEIHCPASGITHILIETGSANDIVKTVNIRLTTVLNFSNPKIALFFPPDLITMEIKAGTGNDSFVDTPAPPLPSATGNPAVLNVDMGGGSDSATVPGGGTNTFLFGDGPGVLVSGDGVNTATFGAGNSKVTLGNGVNNVTLGDGKSKVYVGTGSNTVTFGAGNSTFTVGAFPAPYPPPPRPLEASAAGANNVTFGAGNGVFTGGGGEDVAKFGVGNGSFTGGTGNDKATFDEGKNSFAGGPGDDSAELGGGNDSAIGGAGVDSLWGATGRDTLRGGVGNDRLFGGAGNDHLFGGPNFDLLKGGAGHKDECFLGGPGVALGCERP